MEQHEMDRCGRGTLTSLMNFDLSFIYLKKLFVCLCSVYSCCRPAASSFTTPSAVLLLVRAIREGIIESVVIGSDCCMLFSTSSVLTYSIIMGKNQSREAETGEDCSLGFIWTGWDCSGHVGTTG